MRSFREVGAACPDESVWAELAAGVLREPEATQRLSHAAECAACAALLREAAEILGGADAPVWEERTAVRGALVKETARKMAEQHRRRPPMVYLVAAMLAIAILIPASLRYWRHVDGTTAVEALASTYNWSEGEPRMPGAPHRQRPKSLGDAGETQSSVLSSVAEYEIGRGSWPHWWYAKGRQRLIEGKDATGYFEKAAAEGEDSSAFWTDYASAYQTAGQFDKAEALLHRALEKDARNSSAYFNLAVIQERRGSTEAALNDYRKSFGYEADPAWRTEIQQQINRLKQSHP